MSKLALIAAQNAHAELPARRGKFVQKQNDCESMAAEKRAQIASLDVAHRAAEQDFICSQATMQQVQELRQKLERTHTELAEAERLSALTAEAIAETDKQISQSLQSIAIARRDFCAQTSNEKLQKIKESKQFRDLLLEAMAAFAANGSYHWTLNVHRFVEQNLTRILPDITETEAREATERFKKTNDLEG
ncbi:MAG: hypothetical protein LZF85_07965 [Nitrosomonas sp.]|uniref:hypothetical protein n=1 Tax=Nitrosomonas sp. TaxID=42353 RepID=UPI001A53C05E|nr:hypothetical protein [Nitrosomonas sp.]MBL8500471.1 hypothetical protein [Nitrosomonas sp.]UJP01734.1 MAG: hypothetical protein LZF85_07965 [Nitrosomonas sp.]